MFKNLGEKVSKNFIFSLLIGLLASLIGSFAILSFILPADFWLGNNTISSQNEELLKTSLGVKAYGRLEVFKFLDSTLPSVASIYRKKQPSLQFSESLYLDKDRAGYGFVLTADGWIITNKSVLDAINVKNSQAARLTSAVFVKGKLYDISSVVFDSWTDAVFVKIDADNLPVTSLGDSNSLKLGDLVFGGTNKNNFWFNYVSGIAAYPDSASKADITISSEKFGKRIKAQDKLPANFNGGFIANSNGEIVGMVLVESKGVSILPINYFKNIIFDVLKNKKITRPYLGLGFIDLTVAIGSSLPNSGIGAFVRSVSAGSPAAKAGILPGDTIIGVDDENFKDNRNLSEIISEYKPGEEVEIKILRDKKEINAKVLLGSA